MENKMINEFNLETPCFVVDTEDFKNNIRRFSSALSSFFPSNIISYSVKTNSLPFLINVANTVNCYSEVVSYDEYNLSQKIKVIVEENFDTTLNDKMYGNCHIVFDNFLMRAYAIQK